MRAAVAETITNNAARLRGISAPALIGLLSASALAPVIAAAAGTGAVITAGVAAVGSVGANVLTGVVTDAVARLRPDDGQAPPSAAQVQQAVAERIEAAFTSTTPRGPGPARRGHGALPGGRHRRDRVADRGRARRPPTCCPA
nr:hypothetical protein GCM10020092_062740 [Actinoplanes digitatis]